jgi:DNA-binding transcriptional LysR family regulator
MAINLRLLSVFVLVADRRSFRKAAEELGRSQSAVSTQIRQLEEQLGVSLFHRTTRRVALSPEGKQLLTFVQEALSQIQSGVEAIATAAEQQRASVKVAFSPTLAAARLAPILTAFKSAYPQVLVNVRELPSADMLESIERDEVDFGIGPRVNRGTDFHFQGVLQCDICVVVPVESSVGTEDGISLSDLNQVQMLKINKSATLRSYTESSLFEQHINLDSQYEGMQVQTMLSLVEAGLGAAILPRIAVPPSAGRKFRTLSINPPITGEICIITLAGKTLSPYAARFATTATRILQAGNEFFA